MKSFSNYSIQLPWERYPALFIFASLLSGCLLIKGIFFTLLFSLTHKQKQLRYAFVLLSLFSSFVFYYSKKDEPKTSLKNLKLYAQPIGIKSIENRKYLLVSHPYVLTQEGEEYENIRSMISLSKKSKRVINQDFLIEGDLKKSSYGYFLKPRRWKKVPNTFSLTQYRFNMKEKIRIILKKNIKDKDTCDYFCALATGQISSHFLKGKFLSNGLLHTLAISGFHFSWIIFLLGIPLSLFFPKKISIILLLILAWLYFFFLGPSSSISRSWIAITVFLFSISLQKTPLALNALGIAGTISIVLNPNCINEIGFGLSFLATFTLLTLNGRIFSFAEYFCEKRNKHDLEKFSSVEKLIYKSTRFLSISFFLSLFINFSLLPIFFIHFQTFTFIGIFYNLFLPISMIPTIIFLLLAFLFHPFFQSSIFFSLAEFFSKPFLEAVLYGNGFLQLLIKIPPINMQLLAFFGTWLIFLFLHEQKKSFDNFLDSQL